MSFQFVHNNRVYPVAVKKGFRVVNEVGQFVSGVLAQAEAENVCLNANTARGFRK